MTIHPSSDVFKLVTQVVQDTGFDPAFIESHWYAEEGSAGVLSSTQNWSRFYNNPAGIRKGNPHVDALASGVSPNGFLIFTSPAQGAKAYSTLLETDPSYARLRKGLKTMGNNDYVTVALLADSGWDGADYTGSDNVKGSKLYSAYYDVTGNHLTNPFDPSQNTPGAKAQDTATQFIKDETNMATGATPGGDPNADGKYQKTNGFSIGGVNLGNLNWTDILITLIGSVLIIMLLYRMTK